LSVRYSTSPALQLRISSSRYRAVSYAAFCLLAIFAQWQLYLRGYTLLVFLLTPVVITFLWKMRRHPLLNGTLGWQQGAWTLAYAGDEKSISLGRRSVALPWVIYLEYVELPAGPRRRLWLYTDTLQQHELRRLRVRLNLLH
jgi:hypothetical protein